MLRHLLLLPTLLLCGCNVFGFIGQAVGGPETKAAVFPLPKRVTAVIAEKYSNPSDAVMDDEPIARFVTQDLREHDAAPLKETDDVYALRSSDPEKWRTSSMAQIARNVGAEQILYINLLDVSVDVAPGSEMMRGKASVMVRIVDAKTGALVWPIGASEGYPIAYETKMVHRGENGLFEAGMRTTLQRELATKIGELFYSVTKEF